MEAARLKLWQIASEIESLAETLENEFDGELTPELEQEWDRLAGNFDEKAERICLYIHELKANHLAALAEAQRLSSLADGFKRRMDSLKNYLKLNMKRVKLTKTSSPKASARIQANSVPSIEWGYEIDYLPERFRRVKVEVDKSEAARVYKETGELPDGFTVTIGDHLRVS